MDHVTNILSIAQQLYALHGQVKTNRKRCQRLVDRVRALEVIVKPVKDKGLVEVPEAVRCGLKELKDTLEEVHKVVKKYTDASFLKRCFRAYNLDEEFERLNDRLNETSQQLSLALQIEQREVQTEQREMPASVSAEASRRDEDLADRERDPSPAAGPAKQSSDEPIKRAQQKLKTVLKTKFESIFEGLAKQGHRTPLDEIYTELYITEGGSGGVNNEHEIRQIETASKSQTTQENAILCNDIFKPLPGQKTHIRTVLTKGIAGIGKTVSVQKFILDWAEGKTNQDIDFIFTLPFRSLNLKKEKTFSLFQLLLEYFPQLKEIKSVEVDEVKVVFIFDGLDECRLPLNFQGNDDCFDITKSSSVDVLLTNLIQGNLLPSALLWITSRPAAANKIPAECVHRLTEVRGFNDPQKEEYFRKIIKDQNMASRIVSHIKTSRTLFIMCHIPVFCWISATVLKSVLGETESGDLPTTQTEMYTRLVLIQTNLKNRKYHGTEESNSKKMSASDTKIILKLGKLAFQQLKKGNLIFYEEDLTESGIDVSEASEYSGLCTEIFKEECGVDQEKVYCFVHLSIQEYLAALFVFHSCVNENRNVLRAEESKPHSDRDALSAEEPKPHSDRDALRAEEPKPHSDRDALRAEESKPHSDRDALRAEESKPHSDRDALSAEEPKPHSDRDALRAEESKPHSDRDALKAEEPKPHSDRNALSAEEPKPHSDRDALSAEEPKPHSDRDALSAEEPKPHSDRDALSAEELKPHSDRDVLSAEEPKPHSDRDALSAEEPKPHSDRDALKAEEPKPHSDRDALSAEEPKPHSDRDALSAEEPKPHSDRDVLKAEESKPHSDRDALSAEEPKPHSDRDVLKAEEPKPHSDRDVLKAEEPKPHSDRDALSAEESKPHSDRDALSAEEPKPHSDRDALKAEEPKPHSDRDVLKAEEPKPHSDRDVLKAEEPKPHSDRDALSAEESKPHSDRDALSAEEPKPHSDRDALRAESESSSESESESESNPHSDRVQLSEVHKTAVDQALKSENGHLDLFLRFLLGLSLESIQTLLEGILMQTGSRSPVTEYLQAQTERRSQSIKKTVQYIKLWIRDESSAERTINLFHCLHELNDNSLVKEIENSLRSGKLSDTELKPDQCSALAFVLLMSEEILDELDLTAYKTSPAGHQRLVPVVRKCRKAILSSGDLTEKSCDIVASALQSSNSPLRDLDLSYNNLGDSGVELLYAGLMSPNCKLQRLGLSICDLTEKSCDIVASALQSSNSPLRDLDLSYNNLGDSGVKLLCAGLMSPNCKLQRLGYRLAGLPADYQLKNISSPEINYCLIGDLIIWTQYEIQVAAYTGAGLGVFSAPLSEYTLQGVPTAPPQNVEAKAINSTTVKFTWNPPPQQFINGINQGYKLLAWPERSPEVVTVVTITPDFHGARHLGYISGLRKFTWYLTSVQCFTTPGDGPCSPPQMVQTHEDKPGPVGHLSFTEILDTSLRVGWLEPVDKNGVITGYLVSWEVPGQSSSRVSRTLANTSLEYKVTGLTSLTTYTLEVAAMTDAGTGAVTSSTISSGVPPELPGSPSNLVISKISPRSATLKFRAGDEGKTSISKWIVEGQVGSISEDEEWRVLYEKENEPDAQVLEIPNLTPFTHYRFRMRQVNIVGSSPVSQPSRVIQTLQAPPDVPPSSVTVRTASETSLWMRWMPLPDTEYNGNPEGVGYRVKLWRAESQGEPRVHVVGDRLEREITLEGLEEWTEYLLQIQAFNSIGPGPWSEIVRGRTRESVPSGAPENVTAEAVSSTGILVSWGTVPEQEQNGHLLGYKVLYKEKDSDLEPQLHLVKGNLTQSVLLRNLRRYILYHIQVLAFTRIGDGAPSSPAALERTQDDVPGPPVRLVFPDVGLTEVRVVWQPPVDPNGIILGYRIAYCLNGSNPKQFTTVEVDYNARQFTASGLAPESAYIFLISAKTQRGWGLPEQAVVITTETRERPQPPKELSVSQEEVRSRRLLLRWVPGGDGPSPVRYFTLQTRELPDGDWRTHSSAIRPNSTSWEVERLKPFRSYKLRMLATNDIGDSAYSNETGPITTLQDVPDEPPVILTVKPSTTTSVLVRWQAPKDDSVNGVLLGYRLFYRELQYDNTPPESKTAANASSSARADVTAKSSFTKVSGASSTEFQLTQLNKYKRYEVVITAYNIVGESPPSMPVEVFVGEAAPSAPPQSIQVNTLSATQLEVLWEAPPVETQNGNIQGYKIHYWEQGSQNETEKVKILFLPETAVRLKNLTSYTTYLVKLSAFNAAGGGPLSKPQAGHTLQAAPSIPSFITFSEVSSTTLNVSWGVPLSPNGVLEGYRVVYEPTAPIHGVTKVVTVDVRGNRQRWLKVRDLTTGVTYCFRVQAKTVGFGPELEANITTGPVGGSPGSPKQMSITKSSSGVTIHWSAGVTGAGPVTGYVIEARPSDEGLWDAFVKHLPPSSTSHSISLDRLRQGVSYQFRVLAVNALGYGEPSAPSAAMSAQVEAPFYEEWWFLVVVALCGVILVLLVVFGLVLHGQNKKYKSYTTAKAVSTVEESITLDNGGFAALELNSRLNVKSSFLKKNGTRSPPRPSPGGLRYSDEDICNNYNGAAQTDSGSLTEKPAAVTELEDTDSEGEDERPKHSFVNHYMTDPAYYGSWKRQHKGLQETLAYSYEECAGAEPDAYYQTVVTTHSVGGAYTPTGQPDPGSRTPATGFSSFV